MRKIFVISFLLAGAMKNLYSEQIYKFESEKIYVKDGKWESDFFPVEEFKFYKLKFNSKSNKKNYWAIIFFNRNKKELLADNYSSFDPSEEFSENEFYFRSKYNAKFGKLIFRTTKGSKEFYIKNIRIEKAEFEDVLKYVENLAKKIPPVEKFYIKKTKIPTTMKKLKKGEKLRIVMLGDSIINDMGNSFFDVLLKKKYPKSKIDVVTSVRGGTGCWYYEKENRVKEFVIDYNPDLLIIGGISHKNDIEAIRNVIRKVRKRINPEILLLTGAIGSNGDPRKNKEWTKNFIRRTCI